MPILHCPDLVPHARFEKGIADLSRGYFLWSPVMVVEVFSELTPQFRGQSVISIRGTYTGSGQHLPNHGVGSTTITFAPRRAG